MIKTAAKMFSSSHSVCTTLCRNRSPMANLTNYVNSNSKRCTQSTVDPNEIFQSDPKLIKTYWHRDGLFKSLHSFNQIRLPYFRDALVDTKPGDKFSTCLRGKKILDVGCGAGVVSKGLAQFGADVTGIDTSAPLLELAEEYCSKNLRLANNKPTYILSTIEEYSEKFPDTYDAVIASEVIEHVVEKELFVESCVRATKPGGKLFFTTPNKTLFARFYIVFAFENIIRCCPKNVHQFEKFLRPSELQHMLEMNDCHVESIKGFLYYPWNDTWAWTNTKMFSFAMEAVKS